MSPLKATVITPNLNQSKFLGETIQSVLEQTHSDLEHILIDGGSIDGSTDVLRRYPHLNWISEPDRGQADAVNKGFMMARGDVIGWLNSDDTYLPGAVEQVCHYFFSHPDVDMAYGDLFWIDSSGKVIKKAVSRPFNLVDLVLSGNYIPQPTVFFRRLALERVGYLDTCLRHAMDYDYWIRFALAGCKIDYIPTVLANFRLHPSSKTTQELRHQWEEEGRIRRRYARRVSRIPLKSLQELKSEGVLRVLIFGTGRLGYVLFSILTRDGFDVFGFVDSEKGRCGNVFLGKRIFHPDEVKGLHFDRILIGSQYANEIIETLAAIGMEGEAVVPFLSPDDRMEFFKQEVFWPNR